MMDLMHIAIIELFLTIDTMKQTPLYCAVWNNRIDAVELLIYHDANVNANNGTLLHIASKCGYVDCVKLLLEGGADPNVIVDELTPLHHAAHECPYGNRYAIAKLLIQYGARINCKDDYGYTPIYLASKDHNVKMMILLLDHGALYTDIYDNGAMYADLIEEGIINQGLSALELRSMVGLPTIQALIYMVRKHCIDPLNSDRLIKRLEVAFNL